MAHGAGERFPLGVRSHCRAWEPGVTGERGAGEVRLLGHKEHHPGLKGNAHKSREDIMNGSKELFGCSLSASGLTPTPGYQRWQRRASFLPECEELHQGRPTRLPAAPWPPENPGPQHGPLPAPRCATWGQA